MRSCSLRIQGFSRRECAAAKAPERGCGGRGTRLNFYSSRLARPIPPFSRMLRSKLSGPHGRDFDPFSRWRKSAKALIAFSSALKLKPATQANRPKFARTCLGEKICDDRASADGWKRGQAPGEGRRHWRDGEGHRSGPPDRARRPHLPVSAVQYSSGSMIPTLSSATICSSPNTPMAIRSTPSRSARICSTGACLARRRSAATWSCSSCRAMVRPITSNA